MKLRLSKRAARDLVEISAYIRRHNPEAALKVRDALTEALELASRFRKQADCSTKMFAVSRCRAIRT